MLYNGEFAGSARPCPLTPALLEVLQACAHLCDVSTADIAARLYRSKNTIRTEFRRILKLVGVHSRTAALCLAFRQGWVTLDRAEFAPSVRPCPLTPALLRVLQACAHIRRHQHTIRTEFRCIFELLGVRSRTAALCLALRNGWITLASVPAPEESPRPSHR